MNIGSPLHSKGTSYKTKELTNNCYGDMKGTDDLRSGSTEKYPKSIVRFQKPHPSCAVHPTQKPVELLEYLIKTYSNEDDTILDNTMGSGSTGVACVNTNRNFIGIELNDEYFAVAEKRINEAQQLALF
jgi:site-specific DNA-methyltransferase (adenine-specific)